MSREDAIVSTDILDMLNIHESEPIQIKYDLLQLVPQSLQEFEKLIFDYVPEGPEHPTKGELFLQMLDIDQSTLVIDFYNSIVSQYAQGTERLMDEIFKAFDIDTLTPLYAVLDTLFDSMIRQDFHLTKNYTVLKGVEKSYAKWPKAFGNAIFVDSKYLIENIIEMIYNNAVNVVTRNDQDANLVL